MATHYPQSILCRFKLEDIGVSNDVPTLSDLSDTQIDYWLAQGGEPIICECLHSSNVNTHFHRQTCPATYVYMPLSQVPSEQRAAVLLEKHLVKNDPD